MFQKCISLSWLCEGDKILCQKMGGDQEFQLWATERQASKSTCGCSMKIMTAILNAGSREAQISAAMGKFVANFSDLFEVFHSCWFDQVEHVCELDPSGKGSYGTIRSQQLVR